MGSKIARRTVVLRICLAVIAAGAMIAGSYALVSSGEYFAAGEGAPGPKDGRTGPAGRPDVRGTVVSRMRNSADLAPGVMVVTVPLGVHFESPGCLYGLNAKKPVQLGPVGVKGMTQDSLGSQAGIMLPDGRRLLYPFWEQLTRFPTYAPGDPEVVDGTPMGTPSIRMHDIVSGEDTLVVSGARSMAWRSDGMFAYSRGVEANYRLNVPYLQHVIVQRGLDGAPEVWTPDAGQYTVLGWVQDTLLVWRQSDGEERELLALDGPGIAGEVLPEGDRFLGTSPDGGRILVSSGGTGPGGALVIREIEWETGREVANVSFEGVVDPDTGQPITAASEACWEGETVAVTLSPASLAVLSAEGDTLTLEDVVTIKYPKVRFGSVEELLLDPSGSTINLVMAEGTDAIELERTAVITYDIASGECTRWIVPGVPAVTRLVSNPSRPR